VTIESASASVTRPKTLLKGKVPRGDLGQTDDLRVGYSSLARDSHDTASLGQRSFSLSVGLAATREEVERHLFGGCQRDEGVDRRVDGLPVLPGPDDEHRWQARAALSEPVKRRVATTLPRLQL
jgi:hypothetical protein